MIDDVRDGIYGSPILVRITSLQPTGDLTSWFACTQNKNKGKIPYPLSRSFPPSPSPNKYFLTSRGNDYKRDRSFPRNYNEELYTIFAGQRARCDLATVYKTINSKIYTGGIVIFTTIVYCASKNTKTIGYDPLRLSVSNRNRNKSTYLGSPCK